MYKPLIPFSLFIAVFINGCKKESTSTSASGGFEIKLEQGDNQSDTIGKTLSKELIFSYTKDGDTLNLGYLRFETYNCDGDVVTKEFEVGKDSYFNMPVSYAINWQLNATVGTQTFKAILLDALKVSRDSVLVTATGLPNAKGWYVSGCIPWETFTVTFCKLNSGRIFTALHQADYPYYSDDEGVSWHALKTFPGKYNINKMITTSLNELFVGVEYVGMFYSNDGGQSWELRNTGLPVSDFWGDIQYTGSGKLFVLTGKGIFTSPDKGLNWHEVTFGLSYYTGFSEATSTSDNTIYAIHGNALVRSYDGGESWGGIYSLSSTSYVSCVFVDDNDDVYIGYQNWYINDYGLFVSKDKCKTWAKVYKPQPSPGFDKNIYQMSKYNGIYYFYSTDENILTSTKDFITYTTIAPHVGSNNGRYSFRYIVSNNNHNILGTEYYGILYYVP
jgi:photosystem II stability/assembly factor-like uncharacterized protein